MRLTLTPGQQDHLRAATADPAGATGAPGADLLTDVLSCEGAGAALARPELPGRLLLARAAGWPGLAGLRDEPVAVGHLVPAGSGEALRLLVPDRAVDGPGSVLLVLDRPAVVLLDLSAPGVRRAAVPVVDRRPVLEVRVPDAGQARTLTTARQVADDLVATGRLLECARLVGVMQWALEQTLERARQRHQFGRPIGGHQAVAHRCAQMLAEIELVRSAAYAAAAHGRPAADPRLARVAHLLAHPGSVQVLTDAIHVHGADGLRESSPLHAALRACLFGRQLWEDHDTAVTAAVRDAAR